MKTRQVLAMFITVFIILTIFTATPVIADTIPENCILIRTSDWENKEPVILWAEKTGVWISFNMLITHENNKYIVKITASETKKGRREFRIFQLKLMENSKDFISAEVVQKQASLELKLNSLEALLGFIKQFAR